MSSNYLNEEKYRESKSKLTKVALVFLVIGLIAGFLVIIIGINKQSKVNSKYSDKSLADVNKKLENEKVFLKSRKDELINNGVTYNGFTTYEDEESYELKIITNVLNPSFDYCSFSEYKGNSITKNYCYYQNQINDINNGFNRDFESSKSVPYYVFGSFIIISTLMFSGFIYMLTKRREMIAFSAQQVMPVVQEGMTQITPTLSEVVKNVSQEMTPVYKEAAKEITKGIKEGLKDEENK